MDNIFSQPKLIYKVSFNTFYKYVNSFESFFPEDVLGISSFELESKTIEAMDHDIWIIEVYLAEKPIEQICSKDIYKFATSNNLEILGGISFSIIEDKDWILEYQKQLIPIEIGKFFISSFDLSSQCPKNFIPIILEASRAFGTGEHATTSGCLQLIQKLVSCNFTTIYDIGTGSGILSFASAKLWPRAKILACDIEEISIEVAKFNQTFNNTQINFYQNTDQDLQIPNNYDTFDLVVSNILAKPLIDLAPSIEQLLNKNGNLILSGFLNYQTDDVIKAYILKGLKVKKMICIKEWVSLLLVK